MGTRFQELLTPLPGCSFTFPSRYWCTIGRWRYLALEGGPPGFPQGFPCPAVLGSTGQGGPALSPTGLSPSMAAPSRVLRLGWSLLTPRAVHGRPRLCPTTPGGHWPVGRCLPARFRLFPVRSPLLGESRLISLPRGTRMFRFPRFPSPSGGGPGSAPGRVAPFGDPRLRLLGS